MRIRRSRDRYDMDIRGHKVDIAIVICDRCSLRLNVRKQSWMLDVTGQTSQVGEACVERILHQTKDE